MVLTPEAEEILTGYSWRGNVRELRNVVEFLLTKEKQVIGAEDLPPLRSGKGRAVPGFPDEGQKSCITEGMDKEPGFMERFILNEWKDLGLYKAVLVQLRESLKRNERYGRQKLLEKVNGSGGFYTEAEVRKALSKLSAHGFVRSVRGRGGSVITRDGLSLLQVMDRRGGYGIS